MKEVTITVDGRELTVPAGTLIIDACDQNDIYIPRFCYLKHLSKSGNCRMCLIMIEKNPKPQPACMNTVADGMIIYTDTPEIHEMCKALLEFVLINHPLDCPICDKAGECMLQDQYMLFSGDKSRFNDEKVAKGKLYELSDRILYDAERCLTCSRCVRFTAEISKTNKLGIVKRGDTSYVALAPGDTFDDPYSDCVTDICPVGALTTKQFRFQERVWNLQKTDSICYGCSKGCNISIQTKNNITYRILPRENEQVNKIWLCNWGRDLYTKPQPKRLTGLKINKKKVNYKKLISEVSQIIKTNAKDMAFIVSSHATNEELALVKQLVNETGIKTIFSKSDREWVKSTSEIQKDDILVQKDKTPNLTGVKKTFPKIKNVSKLVISDYKYVFVWGTNTPIENISGLKIIALSTFPDQITDKSSWTISGCIPAEKHGSFTNCDEIVQTFRRALKGSDNYDELMLFIDIIKELGIKPLGRTVEEVRKSK